MVSRITYLYHSFVIRPSRYAFVIGLHLAAIFVANDGRRPRGSRLDVRRWRHPVEFDYPESAQREWGTGSPPRGGALHSAAADGSASSWSRVFLLLPLTSLGRGALCR